MNTIEITVLTPEAALRAFETSWIAIESGRATAAQLAFGSLRELFSAITEHRLELLRCVAANDGLDVQQLSQNLGRDEQDVHTDVAELLELGLLERDGGGALSTPYDEILIHAGIRDAA